MTNFENDGDEGEVWFGKGLTRKIVKWIIDRTRQIESRQQQALDLIDIGCGNAVLLCDLAEMAATLEPKLQLDLLGIDYSINSIALSRKIIQRKRLDNEIALEECDFLNKEKLRCATTNRTYDYVVDKGTYDAICLLASSSDDALKEARSRYIQSLKSLVKDGTIFILASCNYTEHELIAFLGGQDNQCSADLMTRFIVIDRIETPQIQFGGRVGSQVCCLIIQINC